jgi:hypothetical protein
MKKGSGSSTIGSVRYLNAGNLVRQKKPMADLISNSKSYQDFLERLRARFGPHRFVPP